MPSNSGRITKSPEVIPVQLEKDDILVAYTDGITEAANSSGELWGLERLETFLRSRSRMTPNEIVERIWPNCPTLQMASHSAMT